VEASIIKYNRAFNDGGLCGGDSEGVEVVNSIIRDNRADQWGGGIASGGDERAIVLTNSFVFRNTAGVAGGGIVTTIGTIDLVGSAVSGNTAPTGGGLAAFGDLGDAAVIGLRGSIVGRNSANSGGGIAMEFAGLHLDGSTVASNWSETNGGGVSCVPGEVESTDSFVTGNHAALRGGGFDEEEGVECQVEITGGQVSENDAQFGAGIFNGELNTLSLVDSVIAKNQASERGGGVFNKGMITITGATIFDNRPQNCVGCRKTSL
jgi:hypothetical protein